jgi:hypothetical protein
VDLRHEDDDGAWHVVQCKHYLHSTMSDLRKAARGEAKKLAALPEKPASYRFVTSRRLTRDNKGALKEDLAPSIRRQRDIWGEDDLELLLGRHEEVERGHIKLWLPSSAQLQTLVTRPRTRAAARSLRRSRSCCRAGCRDTRSTATPAVFGQLLRPPYRPAELPQLTRGAVVLLDRLVDLVGVLLAGTEAVDCRGDAVNELAQARPVVRGHQRPISLPLTLRAHATILPPRIAGDQDARRRCENSLSTNGSRQLRSGAACGRGGKAAPSCQGLERGIQLEDEDHDDRDTEQAQLSVAAEHGP